MMLLGIDVGTTHTKAGLFDLAGRLLALATRPTATRHDSAGLPFHDPDELWQTVADAVREAAAGRAGDIAAVGIASVAETGLLLDPGSGRPRTPFIPWFDTRATEQLRHVAAAAAAPERYARAGQQLTFKAPLLKLLWLEAHYPAGLPGAVWLSAADYVAYRLTGALATDPSLAGRTGLFRIDTQTWDEAWIRRWGLDPALFPPVLASGAPLGQTRAPGQVVSDALAAAGLPGAIPVAVAGHDHLCGAYAAGAIRPGVVFDSMGTAETLVGALPGRALGATEEASGLAFGCHVARGCLYWLGALSSSGSAVEWLRARLGDPPLTYAQVEALLAQAPDWPTGILFYPYLLGSGPPRTDAEARAAFVGLSAGHGRAELLRAVLEGAAYEMETARRAAGALPGMAGAPVERIVAAGGGTRNRRWLQIKASVSGCRFDVWPMPEATLLGAALLAGVGAGLYPDDAAAVAAVDRAAVESYLPDPAQHAAYRRLYEEGYLRLQAPLRDYYRDLARRV